MTIALVTGAGGGIGAAVVRELARHGPVVATDTDDRALAKLAGEGIHPVLLDVRDPDAVEAVVADVEERLGPIDRLVTAAGVLRLGGVAGYSDEDWRTTFAVNVDGVFHVTRAVSARMVARGAGAIVAVASNAGAVPRVGMAAYSASKAAVTMLAKNLALELAGTGVRCNIVSPGSTLTPMLTSMWRDETGLDTTLRGRPDHFRVGIPTGRVATPEDIAEAVVFLLSDRAAQITMHDLVVDGGASLGA